MNELRQTTLSDDVQYDQKRFDKPVKVSKILGDMFDLYDLTIDIYLSANDTLIISHSQLFKAGSLSNKRSLG